MFGFRMYNLVCGLAACDQLRALRGSQIAADKVLVDLREQGRSLVPVPSLQIVVLATNRSDFRGRFT